MLHFSGDCSQNSGLRSSGDIDPSYCRRRKSIVLQENRFYTSQWLLKGVKPSKGCISQNHSSFQTMWHQGLKGVRPGWRFYELKLWIKFFITYRVQPPSEKITSLCHVLAPFWKIQVCRALPTSKHLFLFDPELRVNKVAWQVTHDLIVTDPYWQCARFVMAMTTDLSSVIVKSKFY